MASSAVDLDRSTFLKGDVEAREIMDFIKAWKGLGILQTCRLVRKGMHELTFHEKDSASAFEEFGRTFFIKGKGVAQFPACSKNTTAYIHGLPGSFKEGILATYLKELGQLDNLHPEKFTDGYDEVTTGVWIANIRSKRDIPPVLRMGDFVARISYAGLRKGCWECHAPDHRADHCPSPRCRKCNQTGHLMSACKGTCHLCNAPSCDLIGCNKLKFERIASEVAAGEEKIIAAKGKEICPHPLPDDGTDDLNWSDESSEELCSPPGETSKFFAKPPDDDDVGLTPNMPRRRSSERLLNRIARHTEIDEISALLISQAADISRLTENSPSTSRQPARKKTKKKKRPHY